MAAVCAGGAVAGAVAAPGAYALPDGRAYELVSPPEKNGGSVLSDSQRTRAAAGGGAIGFASLSAFGDARGTGVATDYVSVRQSGGGISGSGWVTHAITPPQPGGTLLTLFGGQEPLYLGEFSPDLAWGVVRSPGALTGDVNTADVENLYLRNGLVASGLGSYELLSACPLCAATGTPLAPPVDQDAATSVRPELAAASPDGRHVVFESRQRLTTDTPLALNRVEAYEWDDGAVTLAGRVPSSGVECDDAGGPACSASSFSIAGQGAGATTSIFRTPHGVSDGSDGHTRVFFTRPTLANGVTVDPLSSSGQLYMRVDATSTAWLNASERGVADAFAPATYFDASADGERVFFQTRQALTNSAPANGASKVYVYDASKPADAPDNLTLLSADGDAVGFIGASDDGRYAYFMADGEVLGQTPPGGTGIYLWHDGALAYVGPAPLSGGPRNELLSTSGIGTTGRQARVTPDGRYLLFSTTTGAGLVGYDHGSCSSSLPGSCRELYVYRADDGHVACVSCNPSGAPATAMASDIVRTFYGGTQTAWHQSHAITDDGTHVFFSTAEALVPEDGNGKSDAYEYDTATGALHLISTGTSTSDSWFMDASADGRNVFFLTNQQLVGWDTDHAYDLYDARIGGGFPEPTVPARCSGDACRGSVSAPPTAAHASSASFAGTGNLTGTLKPRAASCRKGRVQKRVKGRLRCVNRTRLHEKCVKRKRVRGKVRCVKRAKHKSRRRHARRVRARTGRERS